MEKTNFIQRLLTEGMPFRIKEWHGGLRTSRPFRTDGGAVGLCTAGEAEVVIGTERHTVVKDCEVILLDECPLFITRTSPDFRMDIFIYSKEMAFQALHKFDSSFFNHVLTTPVYAQDGKRREQIEAYMKILYSLQNDIHNKFNVIIATNLLRCIMLDRYDKIQRFSPDSGMAASRKQDIFDTFMDLVVRNARNHRDVSYYADRLCITARYLGEITKSIVSENPKQIIDRQIVSEIKLMLTFSDLSVQQIADYLHFPDQSYLGRFFRRYVGMSPSAYRKQKMVM